jgi:hypothetical protein
VTSLGNCILGAIAASALISAIMLMLGQSVKTCLKMLPVMLVAGILFSWNMGSREISTSRYMLIERAAKDHPAIAPDVAVAMRDGRITRSEDNVLRGRLERIEEADAKASLEASLAAPKTRAQNTKDLAR